ncbi:MAG TPA: ATP-binding protein [Planctomycetota bacterium]|jgi:PAS domain S-box-containing protein
MPEAGELERLRAEKLALEKRVTELQDALAGEENLRRLNRTLKALSNSSQALMRLSDEASYLKESCRIVVEDCGHSMMWIGTAENDEIKSVRPVAFAGFEAGYLETLRLTWADTERGRGPTGTCIRTGKLATCRNMLTDPNFKPWREEAVKRGYASSAAFPLLAGERAFGAMTIYFQDPDPFSDAELQLLTELANDLAYGMGALRMRAAHMHARELLRHSEQRYRALVELSPEAIYILRDSKIVQLNRAALTLFGAADADQIVGKTPFDLFRPEFHAAIRDRIRRLLKGENAPLLEERIVRLDGAERDVEVAAAPFEDREGRSIQVILRDITERKLNEAALRRARADAERASQMKDEFLAVLSHELRTPLTTVYGWVRMLQSKRLDEANSQKGLEVIERNLKTQTHLIEDLLDVSRIIAGKMNIQQQALDFAAIAAGVVESFRPVAETKKVALRFSGCAHPLPLSGDSARLQQMVWNLVSNAVKFTPSGGRVDVCTSAASGQALLVISDTGRGISPEFLPLIFNRFSQESSSSSRQYSGLGLGLAIVRHIVELHGGSVTAQSEGEGKGATFSISLPLLERNEVPSVLVHAEAARADALSGCAILVVEDDRDVRELLVDWLRSTGAQVSAAGSVPAALEVLRSFEPTLIVSDIGLPGEDGYSFMRKYRTLEAESGRKETPALALTGYAQPEDIRRATEAGFQAHLCKPIDPYLLIGRIRQLVAETTGVQTT